MQPKVPTLVDIIAAVRALGGVATLQEVCKHMNITESWARERVFTRLATTPKAFSKIPIDQIGRRYDAKSYGTIKWAYKLNG